MTTSWRMTRRAALRAGAAAAALPLIHVRTGHAAGTLRVAFWDHWVPGANEILRQQTDDWAKKNNVTVELDFITSSGNKLQVTAAAEAQAGTGHDLMTFFTWDAHNYAAKLEPVTDVIKALEAKNGPFNKVSVLPREHQRVVVRGAYDLGHANQALLCPDQSDQAVYRR